MVTLSTGDHLFMQLNISSPTLNYSFWIQLMCVCMCVRGGAALSVSVDLFIAASTHRKVLLCNTDKSVFSVSVLASSHFPLNTRKQEILLPSSHHCDSSPV